MNMQQSVAMRRAPNAATKSRSVSGIRYSGMSQNGLSVAFAMEKAAICKHHQQQPLLAGIMIVTPQGTCGRLGNERGAASIGGRAVLRQLSESSDILTLPTWCRRVIPQMQALGSVLSVLMD